MAHWHPDAGRQLFPLLAQIGLAYGAVAQQLLARAGQRDRAGFQHIAVIGDVQGGIGILLIFYKLDKIYPRIITEMKQREAAGSEA